MEKIKAQDMTTEQIKKDVDEAVDKCVKVLTELSNKYEDRSVCGLMQHRVVNYLWFGLNLEILKVNNYRNFLFEEK